jgi:hypothetical protein
MKDKLFILSFYLLLLGLNSKAQDTTTLILSPGKGFDVTSSTFEPNTNWEGDQKLQSWAWTNSGSENICRSFLKFDMTSIPTNTVISKAYLYLYHTPIIDHQGDNQSYVSRITESWAPTTLTHNLQPNITTLNQALIPTTTSSTQDFVVDVTAITQYIISNPSQNFGYRISLVNEQTYRRMCFTSSEVADSNIRPKLVIITQQQQPVGDLETFVLSPGNGFDVTSSSYEPNTNWEGDEKLQSWAWTNSGSENICRTFMQFNMSSVPSNTVISKALLYLYHTPIIDHQGDNQSYVRRIIQSWNSTTLTHNLQPGTTTANQVLIPSTTSSTQDIVVDVTAITQYLISHPNENFGYRIALVTEATYRRLCFGASEATNSTIRPKLEIYKVPSGIVENQGNSQSELINIYPNPAKDIIYIKTENYNYPTKIELFSIEGCLIYSSETTKANSSINLSNFGNGVYFVRVSDKEKQITKKVIVNH